MTTRTENDREKAVAIAKDVLEQLRSGRLIPTSGVYLGPDFVDFCRTTHNELQGKLDHINCEACALGSMLLSRCRLFNDLRGDEISSAADEDGTLEDVTYDQLRDVFTREQLRLVENVFEGYGYWGDPGYELYKKYPDPEARLQQICLNIIHNDGYFDPENHPEE